MSLLAGLIAATRADVCAKTVGYVKAKPIWFIAKLDDAGLVVVE